MSELDHHTSETENVGQFRCETTFIPSHVTFATDLPASFKGREEFPNPAAVLGSALASCVMSLLSVTAARKGVDLTGMRVLARAGESSHGIDQIALKILMPLDANHTLRPVLERAALSCPVRQALRADLSTPVEWEWKEPQ